MERTIPDVENEKHIPDNSELPTEELPLLKTGKLLKKKSYYFVILFLLITCLFFQKKMKQI